MKNWDDTDKKEMAVFTATEDYNDVIEDVIKLAFHITLLILKRILG